MRFLLFTLGLLVMTSFSPAQSPRRVACIGDSITYGDKIPDRDAQSYPAVLQRLSQGRFSVGNFGVNGATALAVPFRSWRDTPACREAIDFNPSVAVVMLGINDLLGFGERLDEYPAALRAIVSRFQALPSAPRVFLCTLTPIAPPEQARDANRAIRDAMNPAIRAVAAETGAALVDISAIYPNRLDLLPDGLHPSREGAELIARAVLAALDAAPAPALISQPAPAAGPVDLSVRNEAYAAKNRAEEWLKTHSGETAELPGAEESDPALSRSGGIDELLPLLAGEDLSGPADLFSRYLRLAARLAADGHDTVFLADDRPVAWREALLRQLVRRQKIDAQGGGYWRDPGAADGDGASDVRATRTALRALAVALGE